MSHFIAHMADGKTYNEPAGAAWDTIPKQDIIRMTLVGRGGTSIEIHKQTPQFQFFQFKQGTLRLGKLPELDGQVIGAVIDVLGNCIMAYYSEKENKFFTCVDNVFNLKLNIGLQGITGLIGPEKWRALKNEEKAFLEDARQKGIIKP